MFPWTFKQGSRTGFENFLLWTYLDLPSYLINTVPPLASTTELKRNHLSENNKVSTFLTIPHLTDTVAQSRYQCPLWTQPVYWLINTRKTYYAVITIHDNGSILSRLLTYESVQRTKICPWSTLWRKALAPNLAWLRREIRPWSRWWGIQPSSRKSGRDPDSGM